MFSKLDAKYGYWSIVYISRHLQKKKMNHILDRCIGVTGLADGSSVVGELTEKKHDQNLHNLIRLASKILNLGVTLTMS